MLNIIEVLVQVRSDVALSSSSNAGASNKLCITSRIRHRNYRFAVCFDKGKLCDVFYYSFKYCFMDFEIYLNFYQNRATIPLTFFNNYFTEKFHIILINSTITDQSL